MVLPSHVARLYNRTIIVLLICKYVDKEDRQSIGGFFLFFVLLHVRTNFPSKSGVIFISELCVSHVIYEARYTRKAGALAISSCLTLFGIRVIFECDCRQSILSLRVTYTNHSIKCSFLKCTNFTKYTLGQWHFLWWLSSLFIVNDYLWCQKKKFAFIAHHMLNSYWRFCYRIPGKNYCN
jgi:hypothetical protein